MAGLATPSFKEDFFERVINVEWGGGLAIEFESMGTNLSSSDVPGNFNPASMAFWVRVPGESVSAVMKIDGYYNFRCLWDMIPFVCFGPQVTGTNDNEESGIFPPSYIGMSTLLDQPTLEVNLICGSGSGSRAFTSPDYYGNSQLNSSFEGPGFPPLSADVWHHIMVSWQINPQTNNGDNPDVAGTSKMYCFIDGQSKTGQDLPAMQGGSKSGAQGHMSHTINFSGLGPDDTSSSSGGPINGSPLVFPVSPSAKVGQTTPQAGNPFQKIEMADFYLYCGRMLTSAGEFIKDGKPAKRQAVFKALGEADICLSGSNKWIKGNGLGPKDSKVKFDVSGDIQKYKPDPSI